MKSILLIAMLSATSLHGQTAPEGGAVAGTIIDAQNALPLRGAIVTLAASGRAALRTARTDTLGAYRFSGLLPGEYQLRVGRIGYRSAVLGVTIQGAMDSRVSVGLQLDPVPLEPVRVRAPAAATAVGDNSFGRRGEATAGAAREPAERARQERYLASDVRVVTAADVEEGVTFAEADLLRALQRLPGVSARDDYSAELWTRGAPWDHTRVYFDGIPLYNPVHASGVFSGVNPDAVGAVVFNPGAQPVSSPGGAAATLELSSRRGGEQPGRHGSAEISLASARGSLEGGTPDEGWLLAGRLGLGPMVGQVERRSRAREAWSTRGYLDLTTRVDRRLSESTALEVSALAQGDGFRGGPDSDWGPGQGSHWGSMAARATLAHRGEGIRTRLTLGGSGFLASARERDTVSLSEHFFAWPSVFAARSRVTHHEMDLRMEPDAPGPGRWSAGAGVARDAVEYVGPPAYPIDAQLPPTVLHREDRLGYAYAWADGRWPLGAALTLEGGMRLEAAAGALHAAPRVAARFRAGQAITLTATAARAYQHVQAGPELGEQSITQNFWLLADGDAPLLRSDVVTAGAEGWLGRGWLGSMTAYHRLTDGVAALDPVPGELIGRPAFVTGDLAARGVDLSLRKLSGRWTGGAAYSWGRSTTTVAGRRFASQADIRHTVDLSARTRLRPSLNAGAAFTAATGPAYTRFYSGVAFCPRELPCHWEEQPRSGEPAGLRAPAYASLDLTVDWSGRRRGVDLMLFFQLRNALGRENVARYNHSVHYPGCGYGRPSDELPGCTEDLWSRGLPRLPVLGARVSF